ncbi:hypothetical protein KP509_03G034400 [Ceratopteris richardii]|uniref:Uncharacterized protein n=1 Tax=Ceratopteris richardii TaxID=49495 RepID=A0A8T2V645_CERRI|nr:hypothetical protein KP509_03G034400 [Ceratopteris richardii]
MAQRLQTMGSRLRVWASSASHSSAATRAPQRRAFHVAPGERERALLEEDNALKHYKSSKETVKTVKKIGDILVIVVGAGCIYQIFDVVSKRRAERQ